MRGAGIDAAAGAVTGLELAAPRALRADEVLLDVRAAGVGNWDDLMRTGGWDPGLDAAVRAGRRGGRGGGRDRGRGHRARGRR